MTEEISGTFDIDSGKNSWFGHLLLGVKSAKIDALCKSPEFDSSKMEVKLYVNGQLLVLEDFNRILDKWSDAIEAQLKSQLDFDNKQLAIAEKAKALLAEKLGTAYNVLCSIEDLKYKLDL